MSEINTQQLAWQGVPVKGFESKMLLELGNGTFKMIKIEPGMSYPLHHHPDKTEFVYVLEGTLGAAIGEENFVGSTGMFYRFPVGLKHGLSNPGDTDTVLLVGAIKDEAK
jgi:quercetin dioxygenase-like cupin family protein